MLQYLIAIWDYEGEGEYELSFKQGDRIKLLDKHNDDWWEGELNGLIGFFPVNRIRLEELESFQENNIDSNLNKTINDKQSELSNIIENISTNQPPREYTDSPLPKGWEHAYDEEGTIYYFNESTGESRWERPLDDETKHLPISSQTEEKLMYDLKPNEIHKLEISKLKSDWIRHQGYIQMKMISDKEEGGGKLSSWKVYYAILSKGFLLLYKEGLVKHKKSSKPQLPVGTFDLESSQIEPAGKQITKRKHVFIISSPKKINIYIQTSNEQEFSSWLDDIMRELIARKEGRNEDSELLRLLKSLSIDQSQMKVNRKMTQETIEDKKTNNRGHWFSSKPTKTDSSTQIPQKKYSYGIHQPSNENDVFGGYLHMEENGDIPYLVKICIKEVETRGLESVGIYRLSGPASTIQKYRTLFNQRKPVSFKDEPDINVVTGLLKLYFRELRTPLFTYDHYDWLIDAAKIIDYDEKMYQIKSIVHSLPKPNYTVLEYLMRHLNLVASYSDINKMESSNLALIFSVGLLRSAQEDLSSIMMSDLLSQIMEALILQVDWIFEVDPEDDLQQDQPPQIETHP